MDEQIKQAIREIIAAHQGECPEPMALLIAIRVRFPHQLPESIQRAMQIVIRLRDDVLSEASR